MSGTESSEHVPADDVCKDQSLSEIPRGCQIRIDTGEICGETESLEIIQKFQKLYEDRLRKIDEVAGTNDRTRLKVQILTSWVNDLAEQNAMLVNTVEQLEVEAISRVALLEERLQQSSRVAQKYMNKLQDCDERLRGMAREEYQSESLKMNEESLQMRVADLQNDLFGLMELIRRAFHNGSWNVDGLNFCEITYEDIFGHTPPKNPVPLKPECSSLQLAGREKVVHILFNQKKQKEEVAKIATNMVKNENTTSILDQGCENRCDTSTVTDNSSGTGCYGLDSPLQKNHVLEFKMQSELHYPEGIVQDKREISKLTWQLEETEAKLLARNLEIAELSSKLKEKNEKLCILTEKLADAEKSCSNIKESLTAQVTKKNDETLSLREDLQSLEDRVQQANVQTSLKDDIIKEMRKNIKLTRSKEVYQEVVDVRSSLSEINTNLQLSWEHICSSLKDIPQDYIVRHTDLMEREQSVVQLLLEKMKTSVNDLQQQSKTVMKKGVNFASVSIDDYEKRIQELQKELKDAQNEVELSKTQTGDMNAESLVHAGIHFSKEIAEYRIKIVIAQAALEEMKDELDILLENLQKREHKLGDIENLLHHLQDTLCLSQNDVELISEAWNMRNCIDAIGTDLTQETKLEELPCILEAADAHPKIGLLCADASDEGNLPVKNVKTYGKAVKKMSVENLEILEKKILDRQRTMDTLKDNFQKIQLVLRDFQEKIVEYSLEKEVFTSSCINSELKIQKLQQELESVQDDLEHCIEALQPADETISDVE